MPTQLVPPPLKATFCAAVRQRQAQRGHHQNVTTLEKYGFRLLRMTSVRLNAARLFCKPWTWAGTTAQAF